MRESEERYPVSQAVYDRTTPEERKLLRVNQQVSMHGPVSAVSEAKPEKILATSRLNHTGPSGVRKGNKYGAVRTWSNYSKRYFDSKLEASRADELYLLEKGRKIRNLQYQIKFTLCEKPKITYTCDFAYQEFDPLTLSGGTWNYVYEDSKGVLTRDTRTKLAWLKEKFNIDVRLVK